MSVINEPRNSSRNIPWNASSLEELNLKRHFTADYSSDVDASSDELISDRTSPYEKLEWERRDAEIIAANGDVIFRATNLDFPKSWSQNAINIVAQKYFRKSEDENKRETSLKDMVGRVVATLKQWGIKGGYFNQREADIFGDELTYLLISQRAAFNSPVWFNIGVEHTPQQSSACFILSVEDSLKSILNWVTEEGMIFKGGSGSGVNLSKIRSAKEGLSGGGQASGPISFMRGADASAGAIRSGGTTRRAAKMVVLDGDHPDILDFIWCKVQEERKSRALLDAGFNMDVDGSDKHSIQYQNANNSVRLSQEFFDAIENNEAWNLVARTNGEVLETIKARDLLDNIAAAAWECADPGVQYDTTINCWHTTPNAGRISASNPCSEYFHLDNSACNLASLNLLAFYSYAKDHPEYYDECSQTTSLGSGFFDLEGFRHAVNIMIIAQDILVDFSDYPTKEVANTTNAYRQLGLGYTNLGALLMNLGEAYDSPSARAIAGYITAIMTGQAYLTSTELATKVGPFEGYKDDAENVLKVLHSHKKALMDLNADLLPKSKDGTSLADISDDIWSKVIKNTEAYGIRNSQATVLAPTGTISFMMDCDTTGIEPDLALIKTKQLVGGGTMTIANKSVAGGLRALGYDDQAAGQILDHVSTTGSIESAPGFNPAHSNVFACAIGKNCIRPEGHLLMMAVVQPFISGGISKTVNLPSTSTPKDIADLFIEGNKLGLKALAIYRDNSKVSQPLNSKFIDAAESTDFANVKNLKDSKDKEAIISADLQSAGSEPKSLPERKPMPRSRNSKTFEFNMSGCKGYVTVGEYEDGRPGEIFVRVSKQGSTLAGTMDAFAIALSHGLQYGVPLASFIDAFRGMRFEPTGITDDPELRFATSIIDYIFRRLALMYMTPKERAELNIYTSKEREKLTKEINDIQTLAMDVSSEDFSGNQSGNQSAERARSKTANSDSIYSHNGSLNEHNGSEHNGNEHNGTSIQSPEDSYKNNTLGEKAAYLVDPNAPLCNSCGYQMVASGSCYTCAVCGSTSGCG